MARTLAANVYVGEELYRAGTSPAKEIADQITNPKAWADGKGSEPAESAPASTSTDAASGTAAEDKAAEDKAPAPKAPAKKAATPRKTAVKKAAASPKSE